MPYDPELAARIRELLSREPNVSEVKMFGGQAFLINGNMAIAASGQGGLLVRSDPASDVPDGASLAVMRGRPMQGWLRVDDALVRTKKELSRWTEIGASYARSLPPKR